MMQAAKTRRISSASNKQQQQQHSSMRTLLFLTMLVILIGTSQAAKEKGKDKSGEPTSAPSIYPTSSEAPSHVPSMTPSSSPSKPPTRFPTTTPTFSPTQLPSSNPSLLPSTSPTRKPTSLPSSPPSYEPTATRSLGPSSSPVEVGAITSMPTSSPTVAPSPSPTVPMTTVPLPPIRVSFRVDPEQGLDEQALEAALLEFMNDLLVDDVDNASTELQAQIFYLPSTGETQVIMNGDWTGPEAAAPTEDSIKQTFGFWGVEDLTTHLQDVGMDVSQVGVRVNGDVVQSVGASKAIDPGNENNGGNNDNDKKDRAVLSSILILGTVGLALLVTLSVLLVLRHRVAKRNRDNKVALAGGGGVPREPVVLPDVPTPETILQGDTPPPMVAGDADSLCEPSLIGSIGAGSLYTSPTGILEADQSVNGSLLTEDYIMREEEEDMDPLAMSIQPTKPPSSSTYDVNRLDQVINSAKLRARSIQDGDSLA